MSDNSKAARINAAKIIRDAKYKAVTDILSSPTFSRDDAILIDYVKDQAAKILHIDDVSSLNIPVVPQAVFAKKEIEWNKQQKFLAERADILDRLHRIKGASEEYLSSLDKINNPSKDQIDQQEVKSTQEELHVMSSVKSDYTPLNRIIIPSDPLDKNKENHMLKDALNAFITAQKNLAKLVPRLRSNIGKYVGAALGLLVGTILFFTLPVFGQALGMYLFYKSSIFLVPLVCMGAAIAITGVSALCTALGHLADKISEHMQKPNHHLEKPAALSDALHSETSQVIPARRLSCPAIMTRLNKPPMDSKRAPATVITHQVTAETEQPKTRPRSNSAPARIQPLLFPILSDDAKESKYEHSSAANNVFPVP